MNVTSAGIATNASSKNDIIAPVMDAESVKNNNQKILFLAWVNADVLRYGSSVGEIAAIISISSVASSLTTSIMSSTVTIPTRRFSVSIIGKA